VCTSKDGLLEILEARLADPERRHIGLKNFLIARYPGERANDSPSASSSAPQSDAARRGQFGEAERRE
jgi:hypothetical protein